MSSNAGGAGGGGTMGVRRRRRKVRLAVENILSRASGASEDVLRARTEIGLM